MASQLGILQFATVLRL